MLNRIRARLLARLAEALTPYLVARIEIELIDRMVDRAHRAHLREMRDGGRLHSPSEADLQAHRLIEFLSVTDRDRGAIARPRPRSRERSTAA